jgi:hypothetical protein
VTLDSSDDDDDNFPLQFHEALGEHTLSEDVRFAIVWAAIQKFLVDSEFFGDINVSKITDKQKQLSKSVVFHGPINDFDAAVTVSQRRQGVLVAPRHLWTEEEQPVWLACLAN